LIPKVVENMLDAKAEVDTVLRKAIQDFTAQFVTRMLEPIKSAKGPIKVSPADAAPRTTKLRANIDRETPFLRARLEEYITDHRTREMLVAAVMEAVTESYEEWYDQAYTPSLNGSGAGMGRSAKGKGSVDGVWDPDVFSDWCNGVFKVGTLGLGIMGGDDGEGYDGPYEGDEGDSDSGYSASIRTGTGTERTGTTGLRINM
jgi:hypothetical protein